MSNLQSSPLTWLHRPFLDLGPYNGGALHVLDVELSYDNLVNQSDDPSVLAVYLPPSFRQSLLRQTGLNRYDVDTPERLPGDLRTPRWNTLCEYLAHYQELQPEVRLHVVTLLKSLSLHRAVMEYVPPTPPEDLAADPVRAALALRRAMSHMTVLLESGKPYNHQEFADIAEHAPPGSTARIGAALQCVVQEARIKNLEGAGHWRQRATHELNLVGPRDGFNHILLCSMYRRAIALVTVLSGDHEGLVREMDDCEAHAWELLSDCGEERQRIMAQENLNNVLESRIKEAMWLNHLDLAEERARLLLPQDPLNSRYHHLLGEVLLGQGEIREAAVAYRTAGRLGPPAAEVAWFMAGQCNESLGEAEIAWDCYLASLQIDPKAICAAERLARLASDSGNQVLACWSRLWLDHLQGGQKAVS